ncbi:MAG: Crp/Fnr family transcriptional regulator [Dehalococcoidia bacterium]|nr:Crp/Fnr family transcriptional regulator [Dehalococcoidia bacterium]
MGSHVIVGARTPGSALTASDVLHRCVLTAGLDEAHIERIARASRMYSFSAQSEVFEEGEPSKGLWILGRGRLRLVHVMADGRQQVVGFKGPDMPVELTSVLDGRPYTATAVVQDDAVLVFLPRPVLLSVVRRYPVTLHNAIDQVCLEMRQRDIASAVTTLKDSRGRIACGLLHLMRQFGTQDENGVRIGYRLTRQDIADRAGVTLETAIRVISEYQREGIVRTKSQIIEIVDMRRLMAYAGCDDCQFDCSVFAGNRRKP